MKIRNVVLLTGPALCALVVCAGVAWSEEAGAVKKATPFEVVLAETKPLSHPQGNHPPLFLWTPNFPTGADDAALEQALKDLQARGIALYHRWGGTPEKTLQTYKRIGLLQKRLGMPIAVDGTGIANGFYNGDAALSHIDKDGKPFRDSSFFWSPGCPFTVQSRYEERRKLTESFAQAYKDAGLTVDYWAGDWEFDGPNEWKDGWKAAKQCTRCREKIANIDTDFLAFQKAVRAVRGEMQHEGWVKPLQQVFPAIRVGNYGMNPHDGYRYWWDFYEENGPGNPFVVDGVPYKKEQKALYRPWAKEFDTAGYTVAMPVVYTWFTIYNSYDFANTDFRWFRNMLLEVSSVASNTPAGVPIVPFVHWNTTNPPKELPAGFKPMSEAAYKELLWHALLRGVDTFAMWSPDAETGSEVKPVHEVYAAALEYADFLEKGTPVTFAVPEQPGTVVSAIKLGKKVLVRRTDFGDSTEPVELMVDGKPLRVARQDGRCAILDAP